MKNKLLKSLAVSLVICVFCSLFCLNISAASGTVIAFSSNNINKGKNVTVTVTFSAPKTMTAVQATVEYDSSILKFVSGSGANCSGGGGKIVLSCNGKTASSSLTFKSVGVGKCGITVSDCVYVPATDDKQVSLSGASATVTVIDKSAQSGDAYLKSLSISNGSLSPTFSKSTYNYSVTVENSITSLRVSAATSNSKAVVKISGSDKLAVGKNSRVITVTAENGNVKKYTITVTRKSKPVESSSNISSTTSSEVSSSEPSTTESSKIQIDGSQFEISKNIEKLKKPVGFELDEYSVNGVNLPCYKSAAGKFVIFYAVPETEKSGVGCILNSETNTFSLYLLEKIGGKQYIIPNSAVNSQLTETEGFTQVLTQIHNKDVYAYKSNKASEEDYLFVYAVNQNGEYLLYRYDTVEDTVQRYSIPEPTVQTVTVSENGSEQSLNLPFGLNLATVLFAVSGLLVLVAVMLWFALIVAKKKINKE